MNCRFRGEMKELSDLVKKDPEKTIKGAVKGTLYGMSLPFALPSYTRQWEEEEYQKKQCKSKGLEDCVELKSKDTFRKVGATTVAGSIAYIATLTGMGPQVIGALILTNVADYFYNRYKTKQ